MLELRLRHRFPGFTLAMDFATPPGVTAVFGPSGSGKTTLINAVAGLMTPQEGRIALGGDVLFDSASGTALPPHRRRIGYVFQDHRLFPHLDVQANLLYGRRFALASAPGPGLDAVVEMLGIGALLHRRPAALSGGEKARVAIGRALLSKPRLLLLDEPLAALDAARQAEILPFLERLRDAGMPVLYVSHQLAEVSRLASTLVLLEAGQVVATGPLADLLGNPALAPRLGEDAAGTLMPALVAERAADGLVRLETPAGSIWVSAAPGGPGTALRLRLHASDVILSRARPEGLSALNILPGRVLEIWPEAQGRAFVQLEVGKVRLLAQLTQRSVADLALAPGAECHAILKSVAVSRDDMAAQG